MAVTTYSSKTHSLLMEKGNAKKYLKQGIILNGIIRNANLKVELLFFADSRGQQRKISSGPVSRMEPSRWKNPQSAHNET